MKRVLPFLLTLVFLFSVSACAQDELHWLSPTIGGNDAVMIVDNGDDWSVRLNLRAEQSKGSDIRGRIYTGTRAEVYQDNGEWCTVGLNFVGGEVLVGEVMKQYLAPVGDDISALCPLAVAKEETQIMSTGIEADLYPGDKAYVMAVCGERYFMLVPGVGQGYAPISAFGELTEPKEEERIVYRTFYVPEGGLSFVDEWTGDEFFLEGGVLLEDCWQIPGETDWNITFGAGIQRMPRVQGVIPCEKLAPNGGIPFEGEVYAWGTSFITCVGSINGEPILRRVDQNGDTFWALGAVPQEAVPLDKNLCVIECDPVELLSQAVMDNIIAYVLKHGALDERTSGQSVSEELIDQCTLHALLVLEPCAGELLCVHVWLEDTDGSYVTGGDLDPRTGEIIRWGCNT